MTAKTRAIPSLHRDSLLAKVPGPDSYRDCPVLSSGNTTSPYCRAVSCKYLHMRILLFITVAFLSLASCHDTKFDEIDFIAYSYRQFDSDDLNYDKEWKIICPFYLHINNRYNCQLIKGLTFSDSSIKYFESKKDSELRAIIKEIINQSKNFGVETDFRPPRSLLGLYDGSDLKIRIIKGNNIKIIHFWQDQAVSQSFEKLLFYSDMLYKKGTLSDINPKTDERKQEFIKFVIKSDSVLRPLPPLPPRDFKPKYIPPKVIE
jgi:hypothetical protein